MDTQKIVDAVDTYFRSEHPLGGPIEESDAAGLIQQLATRLHVTSKELDMSVGSLKTFERLLIQHGSDSAPHAASESPENQEDLVQLFRQVAAYIGKVFVMHSPAQWSTGTSIYDTDLVYSYSTTGERLPRHRELHYPLWSIARYCLDAAAQGKYAGLDKILRKVQRRKPKRLTHELE